MLPVRLDITTEEFVENFGELGGNMMAEILASTTVDMWSSFHGDTFQNVQKPILQLLIDGTKTPEEVAQELEEFSLGSAYVESKKRNLHQWSLPCPTLNRRATLFQGNNAGIGCFASRR